MAFARLHQWVFLSIGAGLWLALPIACARRQSVQVELPSPVHTRAVFEAEDPKDAGLLRDIPESVPVTVSLAPDVRYPGAYVFEMRWDYIHHPKFDGFLVDEAGAVIAHTVSLQLGGLYRFHLKGRFSNPDFTVVYQEVTVDLRGVQRAD